MKTQCEVYQGKDGMGMGCYCVIDVKFVLDHKMFWKINGGQTCFECT